MFQRLDRHVKQWIINSVMSIAVALLVVGFFTGQKQDNQPSSIEEKENEKQETEAASPYSEAEPETIEQYYAEDYGDTGEISATRINESELPPMMEEIFTKEEITQSKAVAEKFVRAFYPYDGRDPLYNIKSSKDTVSEDLYQLLIQSPERPTSMTVKRELVSLEMIEPFAPTADIMVWNAKVNGEVTDVDGVKRDETDLYKLKLEKVKGEYKIVDFLINYLE